MGWDALGGWVAAATGLHVPAAAGGDARARLTALASMLWVRAVDGASRHGPPAFRRDVRHVGGSVRGHLDVRRTVRLRAKGATTAASVYRARELDNPVTRIIVAADRVLMRAGRSRSAGGRIASTPWSRSSRRRSDAAPTLPATASCTACATRRSRARSSGRRSCRRGSSGQDPVATTALPGRVQGLVLDLDGIYREAMLSWARDARPDLRAETVDAGQVVLRDRNYIRAALDLLPAASGSRGAGAGGVAVRRRVAAAAAPSGRRRGGARGAPRVSRV